VLFSLFPLILFSILLIPSQTGLNPASSEGAGPLSVSRAHVLTSAPWHFLKTFSMVTYFFLSFHQTLLETTTNLLNSDLHWSLSHLRKAVSRGLHPRQDHCNICLQQYKRRQESEEEIIIFRYTHTYHLLSVGSQYYAFWYNKTKHFTHYFWFWIIVFIKQMLIQSFWLHFIQCNY